MYQKFNSNRLKFLYPKQSTSVKRERPFSVRIKSHHSVKKKYSRQADRGFNIPYANLKMNPNPHYKTLIYV